MPAQTLEERSEFFHRVFAEWLTNPDITIACGRWSDGALSELMPRGMASLLPGRYGAGFVGVRELRIEGSPHHLHVDLGRIHHFCYAVAPSVCFGFKPSFEVRMLMVGSDGAPTDTWQVSLMLSAPYVDEKLDTSAVAQFFERAQAQLAMQPDLIEIAIDSKVRASSQGAEILSILRAVTQRPRATWDEALNGLAPSVVPPARSPDPTCLQLLRDALALTDASLVIFRDRTLIEFQTERVSGVHRYEEGGMVSWQIGATDDHHCHLALAAVQRVLFSAEPVSCQGGGLNYTVWFLTAGPSGNPYRRDGYFSVVLNKPYAGDAARLDVIDPVFALYRRYRSEPWVQADETFMHVLAEGAPSRPPLDLAVPA